MSGAEPLRTPFPPLPALEAAAAVAETCMAEAEAASSSLLAALFVSAVDDRRQLVVLPFLPDAWPFVSG